MTNAPPKTDLALASELAQCLDEFKQVIARHTLRRMLTAPDDPGQQDLAAELAPIRRRADSAAAAVARRVALREKAVAEVGHRSVHGSGLVM